MFFVVDKPKLQRIIAIAREDHSRIKGAEQPFLRLKTEGTELTISGGGCVTATFPATVYQPGVLFLRTTKFRRLVRSLKNEKFMTFQVSADGLHFGDVLIPFEGSEMVLYTNPADAPENWPPPPEAEQLPKVEKMKALYQHKTNGDIFAVETDEYGNVVATAGPLLFKDINPDGLGYDKRWNTDVKLNFIDYLPLSKLEYAELLKINGFFVQQTQRSIFDKLNRFEDFRKETTTVCDVIDNINMPEQLTLAESEKTMKVEIKGNELIITVEMQTPTPSASGKTLMIASSHGNQTTTAMVDGKPVVIGLNAYIKK
jgi:hypothetical protein